MINDQQPEKETHFFEASDPRTGAHIRLLLSEPPVQKGDSLDLSGLSLKNVFLFSLFQLEVSPKAPEGITQEAAQIRPMLDVLVESISTLPSEEKENPQYDFRLINTEGEDSAKIAVVDKWLVDRLQEVKEIVERENLAGEPVSEDLLEELRELTKVIEEKQQYDIGRQLHLVRSITSQLLSTAAAQLAMRMISMARGGVDTQGPKSKPKPAPRKVVKKASVFRQAGHLADQKMPTKDDSRESGIELYDQLDETGKSRLMKVGIEPADIEYGIKLSAPELRLVNCLSKLLHEKSQTDKPKRKDYYLGNGERIEPTPFGQSMDKSMPNKEPVPMLLFTPYELAKAYYGGSIGGKEVKNVLDVLRPLEKKQFLIKYSWWEKASNGNKIEHLVKTPTYLFNILEYDRREYNEDDVLIDEHKELKIALSPIFRHQIDTKYVEYPSDVTARTAEAYGSPNVPLSTLLLLDYLLRARSSKRWNSSIYVEKLYLHLCQDWISQGRKQRAAEYTDRAIDTMKRLGIIVDATRSLGKSGTPLITFHIDKDWV